MSLLQNTKPILQLFAQNLRWLVVLEHLLSKIICDTKDVNLPVLHFLDGSLFPGKLLYFLYFCVIHFKILVSENNMVGIKIQNTWIIGKARVRLESCCTRTFFVARNRLLFLRKFRHLLIHFQYLNRLFVISGLLSFILAFFFLDGFLLFDRCFAGATKRII